MFTERLSKITPMLTSQSHDDVIDEQSLSTSSSDSESDETGVEI